MYRCIQAFLIPSYAIGRQLVITESSNMQISFRSKGRRCTLDTYDDCFPALSSVAFSLDLKRNFMEIRVSVISLQMYLHKRREPFIVSYCASYTSMLTT